MAKDFIEYKSEAMQNFAPRNINWLKAFWTSVLAGMFIAIAGTTFYFLKGQTSHNEVAAAMFYFIGPFLFTVGLATLTYVGGDLLTSSFMYGGFAKHQRSINWGEYIIIMGVIFIGNLVGAFLFAFLIFGCGFTNVDASTFNADFAANIIHTVETKLAYTPVEMFFRGFVTNVFVCLGVMAAAKAKDDFGKIFFNVVFVGFFVILGTEHVVANMGYFSNAFFISPELMIESMGSVLSSFFWVTLGHLVCGTLFFGFIFSWQMVGRKDNAIEIAE